MNRNALIKIGVDYDSGVERCMGNEELYKTLLLSFCEEDENINSIINAYEKNDAQGLRDAVHELKGLSGNLSITPIFLCASHVIQILRSNNQTHFLSQYNTLVKTYRKITKEILKVKEA